MKAYIELSRKNDDDTYEGIDRNVRVNVNVERDEDAIREVLSIRTGVRGGNRDCNVSMNTFARYLRAVVSWQLRKGRTCPAGSIYDEGVDNATTDVVWLVVKNPPQTDAMPMAIPLCNVSAGDWFLPIADAIGSWVSAPNVSVDLLSGSELSDRCKLLQLWVDEKPMSPISLARRANLLAYATGKVCFPMGTD